MAIRYATKTGNWSDVTVWNGGTLPDVGDDVYPNTYVVTIDQNITVLSLQNSAATGVAVNGYFTANNGITINANLICGSTIHGLLGFANNASITINGNVGPATSTQACISGSATGVTLAINGDIQGSITSTGHGINWSGANGTLNVTGNIYGGRIGNATVNGVYGIFIQQNLTINVTGNVYGGQGSSGAITGANCSGIFYYNRSDIVIINITGNVYGGRGSTTHPSCGIALVACQNARVTINGHVYGTLGTGSSGYAGILITGSNSTGFLTINGNVYGSTTGTDIAVRQEASTCPTTITGDVISSVGSGIYATGLTLNADLIRVTGSGNALQFIGSQTCNVTCRNADSTGTGVLFYFNGPTVNITVEEAIAPVSSTLLGQLLYINQNNGTINFVGSIDERNYTFESASTAAIHFGVGSGNTLNMTGDLIAGARTGCFIGVASNTINVTGNVTAGRYSTTSTTNFWRHGIYATVTCTVNVYGIVTATNGIQNYGIYVTVNSPYTIFAQVAKSNNWPIDVYAMYGIICAYPSAGTTTICAMECGTGGLFGVATRAFFQDSATNYVLGYQTSGGAAITMGDVAADYPAITNVRDAVPYNFGSQVGTCKVPNPASVAVGVPVDHTVGTAVLTAEALWGLPTADMAVPGSIGERLKNASTVQTVGQQIASLL